MLGASGFARFDPRRHHGDYAGPLTDQLKGTPGYLRLAEEFPAHLLTS